MMAEKRKHAEMRTADFLLAIAADCTEDGVLLAN